jgi:hypothetical protein
MVMWLTPNSCLVTSRKQQHHRMERAKVMKFSRAKTWLVAQDRFDERRGEWRGTSAPNDQLDLCPGFDRRGRILVRRSAPVCVSPKRYNICCCRCSDRNIPWVVFADPRPGGVLTLLTAKPALSAHFGAALWALWFGKPALAVDTHDQSLATGRASTGCPSIAAALKVLVEQ